MAKRSQKKRQRDERQSNTIRTFAPEEFYQATHRVLEAAKHYNFLTQKADQAFPIELTELIFQVLKDSYPNLRDIVSVYSRLQALFRLVAQPDFSPFVNPVEDGMEITDELFYVAAKAPLTAEGNFYLKSFREELVRWVNDHPVRYEKMTE